ncbi:hypothetical protein Nepgr_004845 [Nepenthes gracilis]|uniref:Uncharacterized protein n=1 Tax=Nepenthes gracilis TaxID=150966 RepID=A0AAD3S2K6_NEPGR|nr:hypothetical protein Nepgr_004845 [Nepenthes gracilis]
MKVKAKHRDYPDNHYHSINWRMWMLCDVRYKGHKMRNPELAAKLIVLRAIHTSFKLKSGISIILLGWFCFMILLSEEMFSSSVINGLYIKLSIYCCKRFVLVHKPESSNQELEKISRSTFPAISQEARADLQETQKIAAA